MEKIKEELFAWVDDIEDKDSEEDEFAIVEKYVEGKLKSRKERTRLVFLLLGERIFEYLNGDDIAKLTSVDNFIGCKAFSYQMFMSSQKPNPVQQANTKKKAETSVATIERDETEKKKQQSMLRIRKTNITVGRTLASKPQDSKVNLHDSNLDVTQATRPDTAESLTKSRTILKPVALTSLTQSKPPSQLGERASATLFSLPFTAEQAIQKNPSQAAINVHYLRFAAAITSCMEANVVKRLHKGPTFVSSMADLKPKCKTILSDIDTSGALKTLKSYSPTVEQTFQETLIAVKQIFALVTQPDFDARLTKHEEIEGMVLKATDWKSLMVGLKQFEDIIGKNNDHQMYHILAYLLIYACFSTVVSLGSTKKLLTLPVLLNPTLTKIPSKVCLALCQVLSSWGKFMTMMVASPNKLFPGVYSHLDSTLKSLKQLYDYLKTLSKCLAEENPNERIFKAAEGTKGDLFLPENADEWRKVKAKLESSTSTIPSNPTTRSKLTTTLSKKN